MPVNGYSQPIGWPMAGWTPRPPPPRTPIEGRCVRLEPLDPDRHADDLYAAYAEAPDGRDWTYLSVERFDDAAAYRGFVTAQAASDDPLHHAIIDLTSGRPVGTGALMRVDRNNGVIEVGHIAFAPRLQATTGGTEAIYLFMSRVFDELGYRRFEWKCDALNAPSRRAALRFGFVFEGIFRQAVVTKGRNRDTAWYSMTDRDWPDVKAALTLWLEPANFDEGGRQIRSLDVVRAGLRPSADEQP
jgi:RimJ/RimL family protein N-acetyltransferase